jgi:hypothetical protein
MRWRGRRRKRGEFVMVLSSSIARTSFELEPRRRGLGRCVHLALLSGAFTGALLAASPALAFDAIVVAGKACPANTTQVTYAEAQANQQELCHKMGEWFIARVAGGGSIDGPGYQCRMRPNDQRDLGHILCKTAAAGPAPGTISGTGCTQTGAPRACLSVTEAGGQSYLIEANSKPDAGRRISFSGTRKPPGGASICTGTTLQNVTWSYVNGGAACPPANPL